MNRFLYGPLAVYVLASFLVSSPCISGNCFGCCALVANGTLSLNHELPIKNTSGKSVTIPAGTYEAHLKFTDEKRKIGIEIVMPESENQVLKLRVSEGKVAQGDFVMNKAQIGQEFDVLARISRVT